MQTSTVQTPASIATSRTVVVAQPRHEQRTGWGRRCRVRARVAPFPSVLEREVASLAA
ncbi:hypothetical protein WEH80_24865 [Actinomycetes bacterium KLBMP 9759]